MPWLLWSLPVLYVASAVQKYRVMYVFAEAAHLPSTVVQAAVDQYWHPDFTRSHAGYELYLEKSLDGVLFHAVFAVVQTIMTLIILSVARHRIRSWDERAQSK